VEVALIPPTSLLWTIGNMTRYHMIIPGALSVPGPSKNFYLDFYRGVPGYKMLDNGAAEGVQVGPKELIDLAYTLKVDEIVVPDAMMDGPETIFKVGEFSWAASDHPNFKYMAVCQGKDPSEFDNTMTFLLRQEWIHTIAFPRCMQDMQGAGNSYGRSAAIIHWRDKILAAGKEIHCLGSMRDLTEVKRLSNIYGVRGIDTCAPVVMGIKQVDIARLPEYDGRQEDYFRLQIEAGPASMNPTFGTISRNCNTYLEWAQHGEQHNPFNDTEGKPTPPPSEV
jgi:hypothetical protein